VWIFDFFTNKIFLSIFWLEIWWDVVNHRITPFVQVSWVLAGRYNNNDILLRTRGPYHRHKSTKSG